MLICPKPNLRTVIIGNVQSVMDVQDARFVQDRLPSGAVKIRSYGHYSKQVKANQLPSACHDVTEQYKLERGMM